MARIKNCKRQGFAYAKDGYKNVHIICDYDGENHKKEYCLKCENYEPRTPKEIVADDMGRYDHYTDTFIKERR